MIVRESGIKLQCSTEEGETTFGSSYRGLRKNEVSSLRSMRVCGVREQRIKARKIERVKEVGG